MERHNAALARRPERSEIAAVPAFERLPPLWLESWNLADLIGQLTREQVQQELSHWEFACQPADPKTVAVLLEQTLELYGVPDNWDAIAIFHLEVS